MTACTTWPSLVSTTVTTKASETATENGAAVGLATTTEALIASSKKQLEFAQSAQLKAHFLRLKPGQNLQTELQKFLLEQNIRAGSIVSAVGSLNWVDIRFANQKNIVSLVGPFEVVALSGTVSLVSGAHLHLLVSDGDGKTIGGHLGSNSEIYTTLEMLILEACDLTFIRELDPTFGYRELKFEKEKMER